MFHELVEIWHHKKSATWGLAPKSGWLMVILTNLKMIDLGYKTFGIIIIIIIVVVIIMFLSILCLPDFLVTSFLPFLSTHHISNHFRSSPQVISLPKDQKARSLLWLCQCPGLWQGDTTIHDEMSPARLYPTMTLLEARSLVPGCWARILPKPLCEVKHIEDLWGHMKDTT